MLRVNMVLGEIHNQKGSPEEIGPERAINSEKRGLEEAIRIRKKAWEECFGKPPFYDEFTGGGYVTGYGISTLSALKGENGSNGNGKRHIDDLVIYVQLRADPRAEIELMRKYEDLPIVYLLGTKVIQD